MLYQTTWQGNTITTELPTGMHVIVTVSNVIGFISNVYEQSHLTQFGEKNVSFAFEDAGVGAYVESSDHLLYTASRWSTAKTANAVVLLLDTHKYRIAPVYIDLFSCPPLGQQDPRNYVTTVFVGSDNGATDAGALLLDQDFNGKLYTEQWKSYYEAEGISTDTQYCGVYVDRYKFKDGSKAYWASAGQCREIELNLTAVQACMSKLGISDYRCGLSSSYGSTPYSRKNTWYVYIANHGMGQYRYCSYDYSEKHKTGSFIQDYE